MSRFTSSRLGSYSSDLDTDSTLERRFRGNPGLPSNQINPIKIILITFLISVFYILTNFRVYYTIHRKETGGTDEF